MFKEKLAIIIPTKNRPAELRRLLESVSAQNVRPDQIVIVDGGNIPSEEIPEKFPDLKIDYIRTVSASLTLQRNIGIRELKRGVSLAAFFDDDIILEESALENMLNFWETAPENTAGASFNIINVPYKKSNFLEKVFLVNAEKPARILRSGFQSRFSFQNETAPAQWLVGCAMVWRKSIFGEFMFDEWFSGYARYEEVDFSYRVGRKYRMFVVAPAGVKHLNGPENIDFSFSLGKMQIVNRVYFVKKNPGLSVFLCYWACFGLFLNNLSRGLFCLDRRHILRCKGNAAGFMEILLKKFPYR